MKQAAETVLVFRYDYFWASRASKASREDGKNPESCRLSGEKKRGVGKEDKDDTIDGL